MFKRSSPEANQSGQLSARRTGVLGAVVLASALLTSGCAEPVVAAPAKPVCGTQEIDASSFLHTIEIAEWQRGSLLGYFDADAQDQEWAKLATELRTERDTNQLPADMFRVLQFKQNFSLSPDALSDFGARELAGDRASGLTELAVRRLEDLHVVVIPPEISQADNEATTMRYAAC